MKFLRTTSTRRLLALVAGVVVAIGGGTAIAVAAAGGGPTPPPKSLASALHQAATAPAIQGISGRVSFANHLIASSNIQGSDPILTGASGRFWISSEGRLRIELQSDNGDAQVVVNNGAFWVYDPSSNTAYEGNLPADTSSTKADKKQAHDGIPSIATIQSWLSRLAQHANLSGAIPGDVAGQPAYTVRVSPQHSGGLLGNIQLAWDAVRGVPLRFAVYARGDNSPVLELKVTDISYGPVPPSDFATEPPAGTKIVKVNTLAGASGQASAADRAAEKRGKGKVHQDVTGVAAVARHLPFSLVAPRSLVGLPRQSVSLLDWGGHPAALVTYGQGLGGIAVIEQSPGSGANSAGQSQSGDHRGLSLPTVSINGATGQELDTALGTVVRFTRGGVAYTVIGSVPAAAADAAARAL